MYPHHDMHRLARTRIAQTVLAAHELLHRLPGVITLGYVPQNAAGMSSFAPGGGKATPPRPAGAALNANTPLTGRKQVPYLTPDQLWPKQFDTYAMTTPAFDQLEDLINKNSSLSSTAATASTIQSQAAPSGRSDEKNETTAPASNMQRSSTDDTLTEARTQTPTAQDTSPQSRIKTVSPPTTPQLVEAIAPLTSKPIITPEVFAENARRLESDASLSNEVFSDLFRNLYADGGIFANADCPLAHIDAYGFDYDFTLAHYNANMGHYIYNNVAKFLVEKRRYPERLLDRDFDENFSIRGLMFDSETGFLMKLDQFNKIQTDTVYFGRERVSVAEVVEKYEGLSITRDVRQRCVMFADLFAAPEVCLLADTIQIFKESGITFHPRYIQQDIREAVANIHISGALHHEMANNPEKYFDTAMSSNLGPFLMRLKNAGKTVFLLTNSPYWFVDAGMRFLLKDFLAEHGLSDWKQLFNICMFSARKPKWFADTAPFRKLDPVTGGMTYAPVTKLVSGEVYIEGSLKEFSRLTRLNGRRVLYVGDHVLNDLAEPVQNAVWHTCAIIQELAREMRIMHSQHYQRLLRKLMAVEALITVGQTLQDAESRTRAAKLRRQRDRVRFELRQSFNQHFGSVFRTNSNRSQFFFELCKHADVYTASIQNFMLYPLNYNFYPIRSALPHEGPLSWATLFEPPEVRLHVNLPRHAPNIHACFLFCECIYVVFRCH